MTKLATDLSTAASAPRQNRLAGWATVLAGVILILVGMSLPLWLVGGAAGGALLALVVAGGGKLIHTGRRHLARGALEVLAQDSRAPVLYLRPFRDDGAAQKLSILRSRRKLDFAGMFRKTYEQKLGHALRKVGPFVAIGNPSEDRPHLGASRLYVPQEAWKGTVLRLLTEARLVVLHAGNSEGLLWEVGEVVKNTDPTRVVISLPIDEQSGETVEKVKYDQFRERSSHLFPRPLPEPQADAQFLYFDAKWNPSLLVARKRSAGSAAADDSQHAVLDGLRCEFLRVSTPYWLRMVLVIPAAIVLALVALLTVGASIRALDAVVGFATQTTMFGLFESGDDVLNGYRPLLEKRREDFRAIAARLPAPWTGPSSISDGLSPLPVYDPAGGASNTEMVTVEQLIDPAGEAAEPDLRPATIGSLRLAMQWAGDRLDRFGRADDFLKEQLAAASRYRFVIVHRVVDYRAPVALDAETFDPGLMVVEGYLFDLDTRARLAAYRVSAQSDHELQFQSLGDPRAELQARARSSIVANARTEIGRALDAATRGAIKLQAW